MFRTMMMTTAAALALAASGAAHAAVPTRIAVTLNGSDEAGPLAGDVRVGIRIYDAGSAGTMVYEESHDVTAADGLMYVELGGNGGGDLDETVFDGGDRWVEVSIDGTAMSPRLRVGVVPYAVAAATADSCDTIGDLGAEDIARADHDHAGAYLPSGSSLVCPSGFVTGINGSSGDVMCAVAPGTTYGAAAGGGLFLDANNNFSIAANGILTSHLATGAVTSSDVLDGTLTAADLAAGSVGSSQVSDNSLTANDLAVGSVASSEIADNSITASDIGTSAVGASEIAADAVGASEIADGAVGNNHRDWGDVSAITTTCGTFVPATTCPAGDGIGSACGSAMIDCDQGPAPGGFCEYDSGCTGLSSALDNCGDCDIYVRLN